jgi:AcrR family transcriptional regulator
MQPTSRGILEAAHQILVSDGIKAVTIARVARQAHVDVTTVAYHFQTRAGLIEALMDSLYAEPLADLFEEAPQLPFLPQRWHAYLEAVRRMWGPDTADPQGVAADTQAYFDIAAHSLRTPVLRERLAALQGWKVDEFLQALGGTDIPGAKALGEFIFAAIDGIELHKAIAGQDFPTEDVLNLLERLVLPLID